MSATYELGLDIEAYHSSPRLSTSKLKVFADRGPRAFASKYVTRQYADDVDSDALVVGQILEDAVQSRPFDKSAYWIKPEGFKFNTAVNKAIRDEQLAAGRRIVSEAGLAMIEVMRESVVSNETALAMIRECDKQATLRMPWGKTPGLQSRPDWSSRVGCPASGFEPYSVDLKSTRSLAKMLSGRGVLEYRYEAQGALVRESMRAALDVEITRHFLLCVEKSAPYRAVVVELDRSWLDVGMRWCIRQLDKLEGHYVTNEWPRVTAELVRLPAPPAWADASDSFEDEQEAA